jgi:hypothetical protein
MNKTVTYSLDKYSKIVLTVIAACLLLIVLNMYIQPKELNALQSVTDVNIRSIGGSTINGYELPVDLKKVNTSSTLKVDLSEINGRSIYGDKLPVDIQSVNGQFIMGGYLPVRAY